MRCALKLLVWVALGLVPASVAFAAAPSVSPIADMTINAGATLTVNVVAVDADADTISLTSTLPAFVTLNAWSPSPSIATSLTVAPTAADVGTHSGSITATAGGETDTEAFQITVNAVGTKQPPTVTAPALVTGTEGSPILFTVTAADPDLDLITSLTATGTPAGAIFTPNGTFTSATFSWTPTTSEAGEYDVSFSATDSTGVGSGSSTTHITVLNLDRGLITITPIADVTLAVGDSVQLNVNVTDPDSGAVNLTSSLPAFATLNPPTSETGLGSLATTITLKPGAGTAGTYTAWVTATTGSEAATDTFMVTVTDTTTAADFQTHASMIGNFNPHRKKICFRIRQEDAGFDLGKADLFSVMLHWQGKTLAGSSKLETSCEDDEDEGECDDCGDHHGDGDDGDDDHDDAAHLAAAHDSTDCDNECEIEGLRTCFSMDALKHFFGDANIPSSLRDATLEGSLSTGETFVATLGDFKSVPHGDDGEKGDDSKKGKLALRVKPNPLNPKADISFTLTRAGHVTIAIYDLQGRLVRRVLDENRAAGDQSVAWNGSDNSERRVASGTYFVRIQAPQGQQVRAVRVVK